jgi:hypothetical protein
MILRSSLERTGEINAKNALKLLLTDEKVFCESLGLIMTIADLSKKLRMVVTCDKRLKKYTFI